MRHLVIALVAAGLLAGCADQKTQPQVAQTPTPPRPLEELKPMDGPTDLTDMAGPEVRPIQPASPPPLVKPAPPPVVAPPEPTVRTHTVAKDDTLWSIAAKMLGDGKRWREIADLNPGLEPTKMPVGRVIKIPAK